jgi:hypothetical protein
MSPITEPTFLNHYIGGRVRNGFEERWTETRADRGPTEGDRAGAALCCS